MSPSTQALSVRQPWAALIVTGAKTVENRRWHPPEHVIGARLAIHASLSRRDHPSDAAAAPFDDVRGAVLGTVVVTDVVRDASSPWAIDGHWHWVLEQPFAFPEPILCTGGRGLWAIPQRVERQMRAQRLQAECACLGQ
jgi:ASCH domain-containing protein